MSYDIAFEVKVEGVDAYVAVGNCEANVTWNVREIIERSTGLEWKNEENNGLCIDVIPKIIEGLGELEKYPEKYKEFESPNGYGTVQGTKRFFMQILKDWEMFQTMFPELVTVATFWII